MPRWLLPVLSAACFAAVTAAQTPGVDEDVARRQLDSGRAFARQGNYAEALKDFRAVADTHPSTSVADDALLEIAQYQFEIAGDKQEAAAAVDVILKKYATSDSAPDAYILAGRLALARGRQSADLDEALANFDRVGRLFPGAAAVPRALVFTGEALWAAGRFEEALLSLARVQAEYPSSAAVPEAVLGTGKLLASLGEPYLALDELQRVRNLWPRSPAAAAALVKLTLLQRLYVKAQAGPAYAWSDQAVGPPKVDGVAWMAVTARQTVYWSSERALGVATPANADMPGPLVKPRGLTVDAMGNLVVFDAGSLRPMTGKSLPLAIPRNNGQLEPLKSVDAAVQLSNGDWLVVDGDLRGIQRFNRAGPFVAPFSPVRVLRLAVNALDEVAALERDQKSVVLLGPTGQITGRIPYKAANYELQAPQDLTFDTFGHLYVLDRGGVAVFGPSGDTRGDSSARPAASGAAADSRYRLLTLFVEPEKSPGAFRRATSLAVDASGALYIADDKLQRILVFR